jgi:DNA gyrase/topoisomerase IV subunit A
MNLLYLKNTEIELMRLYIKLRKQFKLENIESNNVILEKMLDLICNFEELIRIVESYNMVMPDSD